MYLPVPGIEPTSSVWESMLPSRPQWQMCGNFKSGVTDKRLTSKAEIICLRPFLFSFGNLCDSSRAATGIWYCLLVKEHCTTWIFKVSHRFPMVRSASLFVFFLFFFKCCKWLLCFHKMHCVTSTKNLVLK